MIVYLFKFILCSGFLLLLYLLFLEKEKISRFNRFYLLFAILFSLAIPNISLENKLPTESLITEWQFASTEEVIKSSLAAEKNSNFVFMLVVIFYSLVSVFLLIRLMRIIYLLISRTRKYERIRYQNAILVLLPGEFAPHSFFHYIFLKKNEYRNGLVENEVFAHELTHIRQRHSFDILFIELLLCFFWINPVLWLYRKAIKLNHEFLADQGVISNHYNSKGYQYLLLKRSALPDTLSLASSLHFMITKKRLVMITKTTSFKSALLRQFLVVIVWFASIFLFAASTSAQIKPPSVVPQIKEVESTQKGVSQELLDEYANIVARNKPKGGNRYVLGEFSIDDHKRLETIFKQMSKEQQSKQEIFFTHAPPPFSRITPTSQQLNSWIDANKYGLWINNKRVKNNVLVNYKAFDFGHVFVSKLAKNATNYGKHYYQVDLMTNDFFEKYNAESVSDNRYYMGFRKFL